MRRVPKGFFSTTSSLEESSLDDDEDMSVKVVEHLWIYQGRYRVEARYGAFAHSEQHALGKPQILCFGALLITVFHSIG